MKIITSMLIAAINASTVLAYNPNDEVPSKVPVDGRSISQLIIVSTAG